MKKYLTIAAGCLWVMTGLTFGQTTQSINLFTGGSTSQTASTQGPGSSFNIDTSVTFNGFTGDGLSYWLEVPNALASFITITGETYFTWTDPNQSPGSADTFIATTGTDSGFMSENRDLGATSEVDPNTGNPTQDQPPGTYKVSTLTLTLAANAPGGIFQINITAADPNVKRSAINDNNFTRHLVDQSTYTLMVASAVPEPATWSLVGLGGVGAFGLVWLRARRRS